MMNAKIMSIPSVVTFFHLLVDCGLAMAKITKAMPIMRIPKIT